MTHNYKFPYNTKVNKMQTFPYNLKHTNYIIIEAYFLFASKETYYMHQSNKARQAAKQYFFNQYFML